MSTSSKIHDDKYHLTATLEMKDEEQGNVLKYKIKKVKSESKERNKCDFKGNKASVNMISQGEIIILFVMPKHETYNKIYAISKEDIDLQNPLDMMLDSLSYAYDKTTLKIPKNKIKPLFNETKHLKVMKAVASKKLPVYVFIFSIYRTPICGALL
jgi:hypothetical protein